jgi:hypothetical protein
MFGYKYKSFRNIYHAIWSNFGIQSFVKFLLLKIFPKIVKNPSYLAFTFQFKIYAEFLVGP